MKLEPRTGLSLREVVRRAAVLFTGTLGNAFFQFAQGVLIVRTLGAADYGAWGVVLTYCGVVRTFCSFRTDEALTKHLAEFRVAGDLRGCEAVIGAALWVGIATATISTAIVLASAPWAARWFAGGVDLVFAYRVQALAILLSFGDAVFFCLARARGDFRLIAGIPVVASALQLAILLAYHAAWGLDINVLAVVSLGGTAATCLVYGLYVHRVARPLLCVEPWRALMRLQALSADGKLAGFWTYMKMTYVSNSMSAVVKNCDLLILSLFRPDGEVGVFRLAKSLATMLLAGASTLSAALFQDLSTFVAERRFPELLGAIKRLNRTWLPLVAVGWVGLLAVIEPFIRVVYGPAFQPAYPLFVVLSVGICLSIMLFWAQGLSLALGMIRLNLAVVAVVTSIYLVLALSLTPIWGAMGIAIAVAAAWGIGNLAVVPFVLRKLRNGGEGL